MFACVREQEWSCAYRESYLTAGPFVHVHSLVLAHCDDDVLPELLWRASAVLDAVGRFLERGPDEKGAEGDEAARRTKVFESQGMREHKGC